MLDASTFGDWQYFYDKVPKSVSTVAVTVARDGVPIEVEIALPEEWWYTDLYHCYLTVDPNPYFTSRPLTAEEKESLELPADGFASEVTKVDPASKVYMLHELHEGDIIYAVDGAETDPLTKRLDVHIKLHVQSGNTFKASLIRDGQKMEMNVGTYREHFRKPDI